MSPEEKKIKRLEDLLETEKKHHEITKEILLKTQKALSDVQRELEKYKNSEKRRYFTMNDEAYRLYGEFLNCYDDAYYESVFAEDLQELTGYDMYDIAQRDEFKELISEWEKEHPEG